MKELKTHQKIHQLLIYVFPSTTFTTLCPFSERTPPECSRRKFPMFSPFYHYPVIINPEVLAKFKLLSRLTRCASSLTENAKFEPFHRSKAHQISFMITTSIICKIFLNMLRGKPITLSSFKTKLLKYCCSLVKLLLPGC